MKRRLLVSLLLAAAVVPFAVAAKSAKDKAGKSESTLIASRVNGASAVSQAVRAAGQRDIYAGITEDERATLLQSALDILKLGTNRYRVIGVNETIVKVDGLVRQYAYTMIYDYTANRPYLVINDISDGVPGALVRSEILNTMVPPTFDEYAEARELTLGLDETRALMKRKDVFIQEGFPMDTPAPCDVDRCVQMQVNERLPDGRVQFLLLVTVDLSRREVAEARVPKTPTSMQR